MRVKVEGTEQLTRISKALTEKGNSKALKRRMTKAFKKVAEPITRDQREDEARDLPKRGGAAALISGAMRTTIRTNYDRPSVDIVDSWPGHDIKAIEQGKLRHPTFVHFTPAGEVGRGKGEWFVTAVKPKILETSFAEHKPEVVIELAKSMDELAEEITRET